MRGDETSWMNPKHRFIIGKVATPRNILNKTKKQQNDKP